MWVEPNGKTYRIRELVAGDKITLASGYATESAAIDAMTIMKADALRGDRLIPRGGELTLNEWIDLWWPVYKRALKETSRVSIGGVIDRYIRAMLGHITLAEISDSPLIVQRWVNDLLDGRTKVKRPKPLASKTVCNAHGQLFVILAAAIRGKYVRQNPCDHTVLPESGDTEMMFLTHAEADRVIEVLPAYWRPLFLILLATGLRWSEAMGLRARDIDRGLNRLQVRINTVEIAGRFVDQTPKTKRGKRPVSFPECVGLLFDLLLAGSGPDDHVFLGPKGGMIRRKELYEMWHVARIQAGKPGLRIHDLRHSHVAWLIADKVQMSAISRRIGHKSSAFTDDQYGHLLPEVDEGVVFSVEMSMGKINFRGDVGELNPAEASRSQPGQAE
jgi:integrase